MATTVDNIYFKALSLYDEISKTGNIDAAKTADYRVRTPSIADMLQKELWDTSDNAKIFEFEYTPTTGWVKTTLPTNFKSIKQIIIDYEFDNYLVYSDYKLEKDGVSNYLYINFGSPCTVRVIYKPYPVTITALTNTFEIDDITLQGVAYGLCKWFAISEQNKFVAEYCDAKFQEIKNTKVKHPAAFEQIIDVY